MPILSSFLQQLLNVNEHPKADQMQTDPASRLIMSEIWVGKWISNAVTQNEAFRLIFNPLRPELFHSMHF